MSDKVILVDLDGPVYPFAEHMAILIATTQLVQYTAQELMDLYKNWSMWEDWGVEKGQFFWCMDKWIQEGIIYAGLVQGKIMEPVAGSRQALWALSDSGWEIHYVTSRLNRPGLNTKVVVNSISWLAATGMPLDSLTFTDGKQRISGDVIVDDREDHLFQHPAALRFLFPLPHNRALASNFEYEKLNDVSPWDEVLEKIL